MLTTRVTHSLPPEWRGSYTIDRAIKWVEQRDQDGPTLLVIDRSRKIPIGLVILFEIDGGENLGIEVRLGYMLAKDSWGKGFATELIQGFVKWCQGSPISTIIGGVERDNIPSQRVMEKSGFICDPNEDDQEIFYKLKLRPNNAL